MSQNEGASNKEIDVMRQILQRMIKKSELCWRNGINISGETLFSGTAKTYESLIKRMYPCKWTALDLSIKKACKSKGKIASNDVGYVYFPPFYGDDREFVPVITFEADFSGEYPQFCFRVALLAYDKNWRLRIFGFRFETPHPDSNHEFYHAQLTRDPLNIEARAKPEEIEMIAKWSPQHIPCILAPASGPASLLVWLIANLYGKKVLPLISTITFGKSYTEPLSYLKTR